MKRKTWLRRHPRCAVLATGALALLISALPLAALHMADVPLFTRSHNRSWRSVQSVQVSGEDLYLVQTLRERNQQDFYCYNVNNRVKHASQACFSRTHA